MFWNFGKASKKSGSRGRASKEIREKTFPLPIPLKAIISELGGEVLELRAISKENIYLLSSKPLTPGRVVNLILDLSFGGDEEPVHIKALVLSSKVVGGPFDKRYEIVLRPVLKGERQLILYNRRKVLLFNLLDQDS